MRKTALLFSFILIFNSVIYAQEIIENPEKPLSKNAGRIVQLKEIHRITDESGKYFFRRPTNFQVSPNGDLFIQDNEQLLQFDSEGAYIRNVFKKGKGPGEIESYFNYYIHQNEIFIYDFSAIKVIQTDLEGNLINQIKIEPGPYNGFCGVTENWYVFMKDIPPPLSVYKNKLYDMKCVIKLVSKNGKIEKDSHTFPRKVFLSVERRGRTSWVRWFSALSDDAKILYVSHTSEYLIEAFDLEKGRILRCFNRKYPRIKYVNQGWEDNYYKRYNAPKIKYENDVEGLLINKNFIWVKTSTKDKKKGFLIDVFDSDGKYIDNFYLNLDGSLMAAQGDYIFALESDEDENLQIVKYKIID
ncbi:MAG: 6-bladed beta-propeller [Candidatus Aminicenantes bacterium]|nr:6-bladed beta-propeller [Candidatus Aminicenantes bacterium]